MKASLRQRRGLGVAALALVLSLTAAGCGLGSSTKAVAGAPTYSRDGVWTVFTSDRTGTDEIYVARVGSGDDRITDSDDGSGGPAWSPDGSKIVFSRSTGKGRPDPASRGLFVVNRDGSGLRQLTNGDDSGPCWAADGETIVFMRGGRGYHVRAIDADGTGGRGLLRNARDPACSPARPTIAFTDAEGTFVGLLDLTSGTRSVLARTMDATEDSWPTWSLDGRQIAFEAQRPRVPSDPVLEGPWAAPWYFAEIYVVDSDGSGLKRLTENSVGDRWPTWTPDARILFLSNRSAADDLTDSEASEYYVMESDGTDVRAFEWEPTYS